MIRDSSNRTFDDPVEKDAASYFNVKGEKLTNVFCAIYNLRHWVKSVPLLTRQRKLSITPFIWVLRGAQLEVLDVLKHSRDFSTKSAHSLAGCVQLVVWSQGQERKRDRITTMVL